VIKGARNRQGNSKPLLHIPIEGELFCSARWYRHCYTSSLLVLYTQ